VQLNVLGIVYGVEKSGCPSAALRRAAEYLNRIG
jgi:hypothetical protein